MKLIKINRDSIKKNPNAGRDTYYVPMPMQTTFETDVAPDDLPEWLQEFVTEWTLGPPFEAARTKGQIGVVDDRLLEYAQAIVKDGHTFGIESKRDVQTIYSITPEGKYLYEYENTKVKCSNCHKMIPVNDIEEDCDDDGIIEICPKCGHFNAFEYEYEKIEDIMK